MQDSKSSAAMANSDIRIFIFNNHVFSCIEIGNNSISPILYCIISVKLYNRYESIASIFLLQCQKLNYL